MNQTPKTVHLILTTLFALTLFRPQPLQAQWSFSLDGVSRYIWRGFDLNPNNHPALQPSLTYTLGKSGFSVNVWGSFSFKDHHLNETDLTLSYTCQATEALSVTAGFTHYGWYFNTPFRFSDHTSQELYGSITLTKAPLNPTFSVYADITNGSGIYASLGLGQELTLAQGTKLDLSATLGYTRRQWVDASGLSHLTLGVACPLSLGGISLTPSAGLTFILLDAINPAKQEWVLGVSLGF